MSQTNEIENTPSAAPDPHADLLRKAAARYGVALHYWDIFGRQHFTAPAHLIAILEALGVPASDPASLSQALADSDWEEWSQPLPPTLVLVEGARLPEFRVHLPAALAGGAARVHLALEDGTERNYELSVAAFPPVGSAQLRGESFLACRLTLPERIPLGYHRLRLRISTPARLLEAETHLMACPARAYLPPSLSSGGKAAGVAVHLPGVRSRRNWGCGDTTDLFSLIDWVVEDLHGAFIALNPLHLIKNRAPYNTSPYLPNSIFYRNFLYLDVERVEDFQQCPRAQGFLRRPETRRAIDDLREAPAVEYERVADLKLRALKLAFAGFLRQHWRRQTPRAEAFAAYTRREGALLDLAALFCALDERIRQQHPEAWIWQNWPEQYRSPDSPACRAFARRRWRLVLFYKYAQWLLDQQLEQAQAYARRKGMAIGLYHDLALATDNCGSDLWAHRDFFAAGCRVGAPPDHFSPAGQDWAFPPPNSLKHHQTGYRLFIETIRKNSRHGGALRIDHVMRFFRLFWIPQGATAQEGTYVSDSWRELLPILALESVRQKVLIVGEDLGTVEPEIRDTLTKFGILSYKLLYFEKRPDGGVRLPAEYPRQALVSSTTHDLPTLAGFWQGRDIEARREAGLLPDEASYREHWEDRQREKQKILDVLHQLRLLPPHYPRDAAQLPHLTGELHHAIIAYLVSPPSMLLVLNQEDITKELEQQNLPGTTWQHPNWRRKMSYTLEELRTAELPRNCAQMVRHLLERSGRVPPRP